MELSREEVYKNKKVSIGVTLLSFFVMLAFFIFTKFISVNASSLDTPLSELELGVNTTSPENNSDPGRVMSSVAYVKPQESSDKIINSDGEIALKNVADKISDNYKKASFKENTTAIFDSIKAPVGSKTTGSISTSGLIEGNTPFGFYLPERSIITKPAFNNSAREEGRVVVEVVVDKQGNVLEANPNGRGTNTSSNALKNEAKRMALATVFTKDQKLEEQRGTITIIFSFN